MTNIQVTVLNKSTVVSDDDVSSAVTALQTQVHRDYAPVWGCDADLSFAAGNAVPDLMRGGLLFLTIQIKRGHWVITMSPHRACLWAKSSPKRTCNTIALGL